MNLRIIAWQLAGFGIALGLPVHAVAGNGNGEIPPARTPPQMVDVRNATDGSSLQPTGRPAVLLIGPAGADWSDNGLPIDLPLTKGPRAAPRAGMAMAAADPSGCLTQAIYYEARSEPLEGQEAVAQVVMNRVRSGYFPGSVCGVVYQTSGPGRRRCQFSFYCDGSMYRGIEPTAWRTAQTVAESALGGFTFEPVGNATHYHADYVTPAWSFELPRIRQVGRHIFYR